MKPIRFRTRLLASFWGVLLLGSCLPALFFQHQLREAVYKDGQERILKDLDYVVWSLRREAPFENNRALDAWCTGVGRHLGIRITYIVNGGQVVADTEVPYLDVRSMDNHWHRPEVVEARQKGVGLSIRRSATIHRDLMYVARPFSGAPSLLPGIVRVAMPVSLLKDRLDQQSKAFWLVFTMSLAVSAALALALSQWFDTPLNRLVDAAEDIGRGNYDRRVSMDAIPEMVKLARAINEMAAGIARRIGEVAAEKTQLETILESMSEGVVVIDSEARIRLVNASMKDIRKQRSSLVGKSVFEVFLNAELHETCDRVLAGEPRLSLQLQWGGEKFYDVNVVGMRGGRKTTGVVIVFHDITEIRRLMQVRKDFVANVSHELRTPLTAIKGYAETLLDGPCADMEPAGEFLGVILRKADHMSRMVDDLLLLTRLESESSGSELEVLDAGIALNAAMETCKPMASFKGIQVIDELHRRPLFVLARGDLVEQVFQNLIDNALRYADHGTAVRIRSRQESGWVEFQVEDEGPGIAKVHQSRIFERFYRVDMQRETRSGSTGLGLAICRHIVENLGGRIWVESPAPGCSLGSVFHFTLRVADDTKATGLA